jgi:hypothetical protein
VALQQRNESLVAAEAEGCLEPKEVLRADCSRCVALCCVATSFRESTEFAADRDAGVPCQHLGHENLCAIHDRLRPSGYRGCAAFECFGAGQEVTQVTCAGYRWREGSAGAATLFAVFEVMRRLKEMLWHLADAATAVADGPLHHEVSGLRRMVQEMTRNTAGELERLNVFALQKQVMETLQRASEARREQVVDPSHLDLAAADLTGADLARTNLRGADLRYAKLCRARLMNADLFGADLFGADLRDADVRGARLAGSLFLTPMQVEVMSGDGTTTLPSGVVPPRHWTAPQEAGYPVTFVV